MAATKEKNIKTKVAGVSHRNSNGSDRQTIIKKHIRNGKKLTLIREPQNKYSKNATGVWYIKKGILRKRKFQIGYLSQFIADEVAPLLDKGWNANATVMNVSGGSRKKPARGVNIKITLQPPA